RLIGAVRHERWRRSYVEDPVERGAVREMEDRWPSSVDPRALALNHAVPRWLKTVVVRLPIPRAQRGLGASESMALEARVELRPLRRQCCPHGRSYRRLNRRTVDRTDSPSAACLGSRNLEARSNSRSCRLSQQRGLLPPKPS